MPLKVIRADITKVKADAIVNTANPMPIVGSGTDSAVYEAAGKDTLLAERAKIGEIHPGDCAYTPAFKLPARYIIHTVGPEWVGGQHGEVAILRSCYLKSLELASELGCGSIAFPLIATGVNAFPRDKAIDVASEVFNEFLKTHDIEIILVIFDKESFILGGQRFADITSFIAKNYVDERIESEYSGGAFNRRNGTRGGRYHVSGLRERERLGDDLDEYLKTDSLTFVQKLKEYITRSGKTSLEIYDREHMFTKANYYKIVGDDFYHPKKSTVIKFCLSLELSLPESLDLLSRAGWSLSSSSKMDLIVKWFIGKGNYSFRDLNDTLEFYGFGDLEKIK